MTISSHRPNRLLAAGIALGLLAASGSPVCGQDPVAPSDPTDPVSVELETSDGVLLKGTFFQADKANKETPIVVMLADEGESPAIFDQVALGLQFAVQDEEQVTISVLAIGLRGQGDSTRVRGPNGEITDLRGSRLEQGDAVAMVARDMEAIRQYLVEKNDAGELNLNRLAYFGVGLGALIATNGAAVDWEVPILARGKQGRDVKALILVSPPWRQLGLEMLAPLRQEGVNSEVAFLLTYGGKDKKARDTVARILRQLPKEDAPTNRRGRAEAEEDDTPQAKPSYPRLVDLPGDSALQGSDWLKQAGRAGEKRIVEFLQEHLVKPPHPWIRRRLK